MRGYIRVVLSFAADWEGGGGLYSRGLHTRGYTRDFTVPTHSLFCPQLHNLPSLLCNLDNICFRSVADIDLWTGILAELPADSHVLGPLGALITAETFQKLKQGDRFFYSNSPTVSPGAFSTGQNFFCRIENFTFLSLLSFPDS